jgi:hypothetical protein
MMIIAPTNLHRLFGLNLSALHVLDRISQVIADRLVQFDIGDSPAKVAVIPECLNCDTGDFCDLALGEILRFDVVHVLASYNAVKLKGAKKIPLPSWY